MSMYPNSTYMQAPPPQQQPTTTLTQSASATTSAAVGTGNMVNGLTTNPMMPSMNGPPSQMQSQQQQQQQQQFNIMQQKQQIQQQQQMPKMTVNMSQFLPPQPPINFGSNQQLQQQQPPFPSTVTSTSTTNLNGPMRLPNNGMTPTTTTFNLPPHLRPPPPSNGISSFTNGGGSGLASASEASANSSRTASPAALHATTSTTITTTLPTTSTIATTSIMQQQPQQQQRPSMFPPPPNLQTQQSQQQLQQLQKQQQNSKFSAPTTMTSPSNINALNSNMQNLNIQRQNGGSTTMLPAPLQQQQQHQQQFQQPKPMQQMPLMPTTSGIDTMPTTTGVPTMPRTSGVPTMPPNNFQHNFKTSALNATPSGPLPPTSMPQNPTALPQQQQRPMMPPTSMLQQPQKPLQPPLNTAATMKPPAAATLTATTQNANFPTTNSIPNTAIQQNLINNNQQQQQPTTQRRPMYPSSSQLPPTIPTTANTMPMQQPQQQQQPYAHAYHQYQQQPQQPLQQPGIPPTPGMFNGQPNTGPLQYQTQQPMPQQHQLQQLQQQQYAATAANTPYNQQQQQPNVIQQGFNRLWGQDTIDLMQNRQILTPNTLMPSKIVLHNQFHESINCNPNIMRCTIAKIPESNSLLQKSRLPLGIVIHPFRDINSLPVIQCPNIVRCRLCRTYINPFVYFVDSKMWKCNLCYRTNELPEDFQFDPATKTYGDVTRRPEVRSSTIEFIAPSEYMLRPPQPAIYLFLFDVSIIAQQCGYLDNVCAVLSKHLDDMPGDARAQVGFIAYNSQVHFYSMAEGYNQPHEMTLLDIDDPFLPRPDNLLVNLKECKELVKDLLTQLPKRFNETHDPGSALGAALQVAYKLMQASGGRITVFQTCLPNKGPGALEPREDPNNRSAKDVAHLNPATDFYKRYALDSSGYQIAVDLFLLNQQYSDLATISGVSKHSGGCVHHFPLYQKTKPQHIDSLKQCFKRYLTRKIGFEAVMRIRCTRGLQVHTFHGNFFVRSTDLLSLPNVNPDAGYGMQISYEETLTDVKTICFQAALLYTNSEGERRIRVHTLCLPVTASLPEVMHSADTEAIIALLSKMAVDRSLTSNVADAREAFLNATVDIFNAFKIAQNLPSGQSGQLIAPRSLALLPLYISALLKHRAFRVGTSTRLDDRVFAMDSMKTLPLDQLMKFIYPELYQIDVLFYQTQNPNPSTNLNSTEEDEDDDYLPDVMRLQLSAEHLDSRSIFLLDCGTLIIIYVGINVPANILEKVFGIKGTAELPDYCYGLPNVNSTENDTLRRFMMRLNEDKPYAPTVQIIRDTSTAKSEFVEKLVDDRNESSMSYYEFLQYIRSQVK